MFDVYCHTSPSGKRYVGQSCKGLAARWREHVQEAATGSDRLICRAIRKHGAHAFRHELLEQCDTQAGAHAAERRWIAQRGTMAPAGYNATGGGEGVVPAEHVRAKLLGNTRGAGNRGVKRSPEQCEAMRQRQIGKKLSADSVAKRSAAQRGRSRKYSPESRQRINAAVAESNARRDYDSAAQSAKSFGRKHTADELNKMAAAWTPEMRQAAAERARARAAARRQGSK